jgi:hypothetical protein
MRSKRSFVTTSAGVLMALTVALGVSPSIACVERTAASLTLDSYRSAVRVYDRARTWGRIARWWIDPEHASSAQDEPGPILVELGTHRRLCLIRG